MPAGVQAFVWRLLLQGEDEETARSAKKRFIEAMDYCEVRWQTPACGGESGADL